MPTNTPSLPFQQVVLRREPYAGEKQYPANANVRVPLNIFPQEAPDPVRDSDFWAQGKPWNHAWAHARRFISTNIPGILAVDAWPADGYRVEKVIRRNMVRPPLGVQAAFVERVNIERPSSAPYGSMQSLQYAALQTVMDLR